MKISILLLNRQAAIILFVIAACFTDAQAQLLTWDANAPEDSVTAYKIYYGHAPGDRQFVLTVGNVTSYRFASAFTRNTYFSLTAINAAGESGYSDEAAWIVADTTKDFCDCNGDGSKNKLDDVAIRLNIGKDKYLPDGSLNQNYKVQYDLNQDGKINTLDRAIWRQKCK